MIKSLLRVGKSRELLGADKTEITPFGMYYHRFICNRFDRVLFSVLKSVLISVSCSGNGEKNEEN